MDNSPQESGPVVYISPQPSKKRFIYLLLSLMGILILIVGFALVFNRYGKFWKQKSPAEMIGSPSSYKPAPAYSLLGDYYKSLEKDTGQLNEFGSPDVKLDEKDNVLIPVYSQGNLLSDINNIDPASLPNARQGNEGWMITVQQIVSGDLVKAREALRLNKTAEAKQALEKAEQDIAGKKFDGVEMVKPATPEEQAKFGTMGRMLGVAKNLLNPYFKIVELMNKLEKT